jgi:tellurium resistance protein TerD
MAISLKKGGRFDLSKKAPQLQKALIGLGWDVQPGKTLDLDVSVFMLGANGKIPRDEFFVFYNNLNSPDGSVKHTGDNRTGQGDDDDESLLLHLPRVSEDVQELVVILSIHEAVERGHHFGLLQNAYIRLWDVEGKKEVLRYTLEDAFGGSSDVEFGRIVRVPGGWEFVATGMGSTKGLQGYVDTFA